MSWIMDSVMKVFDLDQRLKMMEEQFTDFTYNTLEAVQSHLKKNWGTHVQSEAMFGLRFGLCVDTKDPFAQGRIRVYIASNDKRETPIKGLYWAYPISALGGFDDSGVLWVPPAGSTVALLFGSGDRSNPFYLGTIWNRDRGPEGQQNWDYGVPEYQCIHEGHRKGYWVGPNDESQVLPPSNTENYNIKDFDDVEAFEQDTEALKNVTPSHIYMMKTPNKHRLKFDDGNYACNHRAKRLELGSSCGHTFLMWDDHMHKAGSHAHPLACECGPNASGGDGSGIECGMPPCGGSEDDKQEPPGTCGDHESEACVNDLFKHESEGRAWRGPCTPQNNKCDLEQTGVFLSSISGHVFVQDDEVDDPRGVPDWERGTKPFDFGCTNKFYGKTFIKSATGHVFKMGDAEDLPNVRSGTFTHPVTGEFEPNGFLLKTATGHRIEMNDHTLPGGIAGEQRHIQIESTSKHLLEMVDYTNEQASPNRREGGVPVNKATKAYVRLKTGYGLQLLMRDDNSQQDTQRQFIELLAPHKDNCHGPHILRMQEEFPDAPGLVFLRCGGYFYGCSIREWIEVVGVPEDSEKSECDFKASKVTVVTEHDIHDTENVYVYLSQIEFHHAKEFIILAAGCDCPAPENDRCGTTGPCVYPVIVGRKPWACPFTGFIHWGWESQSDRVFASATEC